MVKKAKKTIKKNSYIPAIGRRKTSVAKIRLFTKKGEFEINGMSLEKYFPGNINKEIFEQPFKICNVLGKYYATVKVRGSGKSGQLEAVVHGLSRALIKANQNFKSLLKEKGFLTRDPRKKQRRQAGTGGKARRKKQSPKR